MSDEMSECPKCGERLVVEEPYGPVMRVERCIACGYEGGSICDPAPPEPAAPMVEDDRDAVLVLDSSGTDLKGVAAVLKIQLEITSSAALTIAFSGSGILARRQAPRLWQLERVEALIREAGGVAHVERVE